VANGVRTSGLVVGRHLKTGSPRDRQTTAYYGIAPSVFHALVKRWRGMQPIVSRPVAPVEQATFLDIGAGMGRDVLLAAEMPFRSVVGVELHPALVRIARRNLTAWRKAGRAAAKMRIVEADATEFVFPPGPCVAFLFNPFGAAAMRRFLRSAAKQFRTRTDALDILYVNNEQEGVFEELRARVGAGRFVRFFSAQVPRSRADAKADREILSNQPDGEYAAADYEDCSIWRLETSDETAHLTTALSS